MLGMLAASDSEVVCDVNRMLPPQGENRSVLLFRGGTLDLKIYYDMNDAEGVIHLEFMGVCSVYVSAIPGVDITRLQSGRDPHVGCLIEFRKSKAADEWSAYLHWRTNPTKHFQLVLMEEGRRFDVFAESVVVTETDHDTLGS